MRKKLEKHRIGEKNRDFRGQKWKKTGFSGEIKKMGMEGEKWRNIVFFVKETCVFGD